MRSQFLYTVHNVTTYDLTTILWCGIISMQQIFQKVYLCRTILSIENWLMISLVEFVRDSRICDFINFEMLSAIIFSNTAFDPFFFLSLGLQIQVLLLVRLLLYPLCLLPSVLDFLSICLFVLHYGFIDIFFWSLSVQ